MSTPETSAPGSNAPVSFPLRAFVVAAGWMLLGLAAGGAFVLYGMAGIVNGLRSSSWSTTQGTISETTLVGFAIIGIWSLVVLHHSWQHFEPWRAARTLR